MHKLSHEADNPARTPAGETGTKTAWQGYTDDVETTNPLGFSRGIHKMCCITSRCINLPVDERNKLSKTFVNSVCLSSVVKRYGMLNVMGGMDENYTPLPGAETSFGGQMRLMHLGVPFSAPARYTSQESGLMRSQYAQTLLFGWLVYMCFDYPAGGACLPFSESCSAGKPCRGCNWAPKHRNAVKPSSFLESGIDVCNQWKLRTFKQVETQLEAAAKIKQKGRRALTMREDGLYKMIYTLHPKCCPHFNGMTMCPQDVMHAEFSSGIANSEFAALLYLLVHVYRTLTVSQFNVALYHYPFPRGERPPALHASVACGTRDGRPHSDCHLRWSGSHTLHFCQHSVALLDPLLSDPAKNSPAWKAWLAHMYYLDILLRTSFSRDDVLDLDRGIRRHHMLFNAVPQYSALRRPKHHFTTHFANDLLNNGPLRYGWCFGCAFPSTANVCLTSFPSFLQLCVLHCTMPPFSMC